MDSEPYQNSNAQPSGARRPIAARDAGWAIAFARWLAGRGVTPNAISIAGVVFALVGAAGLWWSSQSEPTLAGVLLLVTPVWVFARLLCNLFDGMVAVEHGRATRSGAIFNELPDRISDSLFLVAAGYAAGAPVAGWAAALLAVLVSYIRALGGSLGVPEDHSGMMAKQRRMAVLSAASALAAGELWWRGTTVALEYGLWVIAAGCVLTCAGRTVRLYRALEAGGQTNDNTDADAGGGS